MNLKDLSLHKDEIIVKGLKDLLKSFKNDLKRVKKRGKPIGVFSWTDVHEEKKKLKEEIEAIEKVLKIYTV